MAFQAELVGALVKLRASGSRRAELSGLQALSETHCLEHRCQPQTNPLKAELHEPSAHGSGLGPYFSKSHASSCAGWCQVTQEVVQALDVDWQGAMVSLAGLAASVEAVVSLHLGHCWTASLACLDVSLDGRAMEMPVQPCRLV